MVMQRLIGALSSYVSNGKEKFKYFMYSSLSLSVFKRCKRFILSIFKGHVGTSLVVQWLKKDFTFQLNQDTGSIPGQGAKIPHASQTRNQKHKT